MWLRVNLPKKGVIQITYQSKGASGGWVELNPAFMDGFDALGIRSPEQILDLPGEVVSGHPDRHVVRVTLPGFSTAFYLKRQHTVSWREKFRNWDAGFGWVSRSEREASLLKELTAAGLSCPRWAAVGVDGRGRAFLLLEELAGAFDLRQFLDELCLSLPDRASFTMRLGQWIAQFHDAGFTTPELSAKHVLVNPKTQKMTLIDWQSARQTPLVSPQDRLHSLAVLHASLAGPLASPRERLRVLWAALRSSRQEGLVTGRFSDVVRQVLVEADRIMDRRSVSDQRQHHPDLRQRLIWVAGEAVCAVPEMAAVWPQPAIAPPFYGCEPGKLSIQFPQGRDAVLIRGRSFAPIGRFKAWARGRPWRSPGVTLGRVLFHLERYGILAPRLLAFGQRFTSPMTTEWFALHTNPAYPISHLSDIAIAAQLGRRLRQLHDAGCSAGEKPLMIFGLDNGIVSICDPLAIRITKLDSRAELQWLLKTIPPKFRKAVEAGYRSEIQEPAQIPPDQQTKIVNRLLPAEVNQ